MFSGVLRWRSKSQGAVYKQLPGGALGVQGCPSPWVRTRHCPATPVLSYKGQRKAGVDIPGMLEHTFLSLTAELAASKINIGLQILKIWFYRYN